MKHQTKVIVMTLGIAALISPVVTGVLPVAVAQTAQAGKTVHLKATIMSPAPRVGDNVIDLIITDDAGQPVSGLKLTARVEMTSMDMGTTHPAVKDLGNGHYQMTATFGMSGPWRTTIRMGVSKAVLDFEAGTKTAWKSRDVDLIVPMANVAPPSPTSNVPMTTMPATSMPGMAMPSNSMPGMTMGTNETASAATSAQTQFSSGPGFGPNGKPTGTEDNMAGMRMPGMKMGEASASMEEMKPLKMPQLQEQGTYVATGNENWKVRTGFGKNAGMVGMMTMMMVGGSGMEGMKMAPMKMGFDQQNYTEDPDDDAATSTPTGTPMSNMTGMQPKGGGQTNTTMPAMTMGDNGTVTNPKAIPSPVTTAPPMSAPSTVAPANAMAGMDMSSSSTAAASSKALPLKIAGVIAKPTNGDNMLSVSVTDANGSPVTGAKITTTVVMTSMDMGTTHPALKDMGNGSYRGTVIFGMSGPWRVTVKVTPPSGGPFQKASFDFNAK